MSYATLEDLFGDIVGKARRGQGISVSGLARKTRFAQDEIEQIEAYELIPNDMRVRILAKELSLDGEKLVGIAKGWMPRNSKNPFVNPVLTIGRLILNVGMEVNSYLLKCNTTGQGALIDVGGQAHRILALIDQMQVNVSHILLTHGHGDHSGALREVQNITGADVFCSKLEFSLLGGLCDLVSEQVDEGWKTRLGVLDVDAVKLPGHTPGGVGYGLKGVFFSGDALFAGSMGGALGPAYYRQIQMVGKNVLSQKGGIMVFPGHGPTTTVEEERAHNPFFIGCY